MNTINIAIDFTNGTNTIQGIPLISGDYASTKINFTFDREDGTKIFEMKNPSGEVVMVSEIIDNSIVLAAEVSGNNVSVLNEEGQFIYEVSLYVDDSKLTSVYGTIPVREEQVVIGDEITTQYLPIFDQLMQEINTAITETNNLNITITTDTSGTKTIEITNKSGQTTDAIIEDLQFHWNGTQLGIKTSSQEQYTYVDLQGPQGPAGVIKMEIVKPLPQTGSGDTIYLVPLTKIEVETLPTTGLPDTIYIVISTGKRYVYENNQWEEETKNNNFNEYIWVNNDWEPLGGIKPEIDLTDYYTKTETNTLLSGKQNTIDSNHKLDYSLISNTPNLSDYVKFTDYAGSTKGGVIITDSSLGTSVAGSGKLQSTPRTYEQYTNASNYLFIGKGTLEGVITGKNLETANKKVTSISESSTDTEYPSAKCVYDEITNTDNKTIKLEHKIDTDVLYYRDKIPNYYFAMESTPSSFNDINEYLEEKINSVPDGKSFIFITDTHWKSNTKYSTYLINYIRKRLGIEKVIFGGDILNLEENKYLAKQEMAKQLNVWRSAFNTSLLPVLGNHDINTANANLETIDSVRLPYKQVFEVLHKYSDENIVFRDETEKLSTYATGDDLEELISTFKMNYYLDDDYNKIRYIVYSTGAPNNGKLKEYFGVSGMDESLIALDWIAETLMTTPQNYDVVISGHEPTYYAEAHNNNILTNSNKALFHMISAFKKKVNATVYVPQSAGDSKLKLWYDWLNTSSQHSYDFTNAPTIGKILVIGGHWHKNFAQVGTFDNTGLYKNANYSASYHDGLSTIDNSNGQLPIIYTQCDSYSMYNWPNHEQDSTDGYAMITNSITEQCFDIVTLTNNGIVLTRIGAGENRTFTLT